MATHTPIEAIRKFCLECVGGSWKEVELCSSYKCPLWQHRLGIRPSTAAKQGKVVDRAAARKQIEAGEWPGVG